MPEDYKWSSYQASGLGKTIKLWTPHRVYRQLGATITERTHAYREMFLGHLDEKMVHKIRQATHQGMVLGGDRFKCQSGLGRGDSRQLLSFHYKYLIFPLMLRYVYAGHEIQEKYVRDSELDWTIARPAALTDGNHTGSYWHGFMVNDKSLTRKISHADVADFMLNQLVDDTYLHKAPSISY